MNKKLLVGGCRFSSDWISVRESFRYCGWRRRIGRSWWCNHFDVCSNKELLYEQMGRKPVGVLCNLGRSRCWILDILFLGLCMMTLASVMESVPKFFVIILLRRYSNSSMRKWLTLL